MNPRKLVDVLLIVQEKSIYHVPWIVGGPSEWHLALGKDRSGERDWFPVSPELYKTVRELTVKLGICRGVLSRFMRACAEHGIEGGR